MGKSGYIFFAASFLLLISCKDDKNSTDTISKAKTKDTMNIVQKPGRIDGPVGALYIDNNNTIDEGIPVLFLHSFGGSSEHWKQQLEHVRKHRQAAAFDFR